jgi:hypothetical protein
MKRAILILLTMVTVLTISAQSGTIKVINGKVVEGDFFKEKIFVFDHYLEGRIRLNNGEVYTGKLNISTLNQTLRVISETGDTISISNEKLVEVVSSGNYFFRKFNIGYIQYLNTNGEVSLGLHRTMKLGSEKLQGAYGGSNEVSSIQKIATIDVDSRVEKISGTAELRYTYTETLFLMKDNKYYPANKRNFERMFSSLKSKINQYVDENKLSFSKKEDLVTLFNYLAKL